MDEWYNDKYLKVADDPTFWLIENGERQKMHSMDEVYEHGLKLVVLVKPEVLEAIPVKGAELEAE